MLPYNPFMKSQPFCDESMRAMNSRGLVTTTVILSGRMARWLGAGLPSTSQDSRPLKAGKRSLPVLLYFTHAGFPRFLSCLLSGFPGLLPSEDEPACLSGKTMTS